MFNDTHQALHTAFSSRECDDSRALLLSVIEFAVQDDELAYLRAFYGKELDRGARERIVADALVRSVNERYPVIRHYPRGVEKMVRIFFKQKISMVSVRADLRCGNAKLNDYYIGVRSTLRDLGRQARQSAETVLVEHNLLIVRDEKSRTDVNKLIVKG